MDHSMDGQSVACCIPLEAAQSKCSIAPIAREPREDEFMQFWSFSFCEKIVLIQVLYTFINIVNRTLQSVQT